MRPNIGIVNALIRLTVGFTLLSWATSRLTRRPYRDSYLWLAFLAAMKIGEGITRFCPLVFAYDKYQEGDQGYTEDPTINPS
ncbi:MULTISPECIES: DUF2892 domain-containing protein [Bacillaceae]|uniref:YgaP family membrane protein n=1 Tax=Bacillaceae TaxID=186817 RepID=UPI00104BFAE1|nr:MULTISPECIES: DUF2892 domain-containing protein [Bacillaceae]TDB53922.1 DUF2892 domain-containing protein [Bacillus sp. CBEL-1]USY55399.1 DUF2892 domain-containing protein [Bacillus sp. 1780r2a1]